MSIRKNTKKVRPKGSVIRDLSTFEKGKAGVDPQFAKGSPFRNKPPAAKPPKGLLK